MALLAAYVWWLEGRNGAVEVVSNESRGASSAAAVWKRQGTREKPLFAIRRRDDATLAGSHIGELLAGFDPAYAKALRHIASELVYNAVEHGPSAVPAVAHLVWMPASGKFTLLVADLGAGIRAHLRQAFGPFATDLEALEKAVEPNVSGTFGVQTPYAVRNNAGLGLFIVSGLAKAIGAGFSLVSGSGALVSGKREALSAPWPGTIALLQAHVPKGEAPFDYEEELAKLRQLALAANGAPPNGEFVVSMFNYFGRFAESKDEAIRYRDRYLLPAVEAGKTIKLDFTGLDGITHSFATALLATAVARLGLEAYRRIKPLNAVPAVREILDFVFETNLDG